MSKRLGLPVWVGAAWCLLMLSFLPLAGCRSVMVSYAGRHVPAGESIALREGRDSGTWQTGDLSVAYHYARDANRLQIDGAIEFAGYLQHVFFTLDFFNFGVALLDANGTVLAARGLATGSWAYHTENALRFADAVELPAGAVAMAFYYTGQARSTGGDCGGAGNAQFWHYPFQ